MHLADGILPPSLWISGLVFTGALATWTLVKKSEPEEIPKLSLVTAAIFVASFIHIPLGPVSAHFILNGLAGIILGPLSYPAITVAVALQALLFQYGGITTIGINAAVMGLPALAAWQLFRACTRASSRLRLGFAAAIAGGLAILLGVALFSLCLLAAGEGFQNVVPLAAATHLPIMVIEALVCGVFAEYIGKVQPEIINLHPAGKGFEK